MPSIADSTEIAGVIMLSPKNSAAPKTPSAANISAVRRRPCSDPHRRNKRDEGHDAALAVVVGTHHEAHVGERDDEHDRPEDQGDDAVDVVGVERHGVGIAGVEHRLDGVDRAGPDVAEHDPERGKDDGSPDRLSAAR